MMKKTLSCLVLAFALGVVPARAESISLNVLSSPILPGSSFDVSVLVNNVFAGRSLTDVLVAFGFDVTVGNPAIVQYVDATVGGLFDPLSLGTPMVAGFADNLLGIGPADFVEPLLLATLHFKALSPGHTTIGVTWDSSDLNQGLVCLEDPNAFQPISASTGVDVVPEPGTFVLLGTALVALGTGRRRLLRRG